MQGYDNAQDQEDELISICRHTLSQVDDIYIMDIYRLLVWMLLTDAYGADHTLCMIVDNDSHGLI